MAEFYNKGDQEIFKNFQFVPQEKYRTGFTAPVQGGGQDASTPSFGITNTNAFTNSGGGTGGGGNIFNYGKKLNPVPGAITYVDMFNKYGADSPQAANMLAKAGGTYPGGFQSNEGGFQYTNSFPNTSVQMQDLNYDPTVSSTGNVRSNYNRMGGYLDEGSQITGNKVGVGTGSPFTNFNGVSIAPSFATDGVTTVKGDLSNISNPEIFSTHGSALSSVSKSSPQVGDKGFENYMNEEDVIEDSKQKKGFFSKLFSGNTAKNLGLMNFLPYPLNVASMIPFGKGQGTNAGGNYSIAGLSDQQKSIYNDLAEKGYLFSGGSGTKTIDGKNFSRVDQNTVDNYFKNIRKRHGTIDKFKDKLKNDPKFKGQIKVFDQYQILDGSFGDDEKKDKNYKDIATIFRTRKNRDILAGIDPNKTSIDRGGALHGDGGGSDGGGGSSYTGPPTTNYNPSIQVTGPSYGPHQDSGDTGGGDTESQTNSQEGPAYDFAKGGRAGYFFGGRVNFKNGGLASIL